MKTILSFTVALLCTGSVSFASPIELTMQQAISALDSFAPASGDYIGENCKVQVVRGKVGSGAPMIEVSVFKQQQDGSFDGYNSGRISLYTTREDVVSIVKNETPNEFTMTLAHEFAMDGNGTPDEPILVRNDIIKITSDTITVQSSPKPAYSCKIK